MHYAELDRAWSELTAPGAPFEIVEIEVRGVKIKAYRNALPDVRALWLSTAHLGDREYLVYEDERITYAEAHRQVASIANWLSAKGVVAGDRVAIAMRNFPEWLLAYWACVCMGATVVGMNAWWTAKELAFGMRDSAPKVLFADAERIARLDEEPGSLGPAALVAVRADAPAGATPWSAVIAHGGALPDATIDPDQDLCVFYTSGTTGFPKGALITHRSATNNLMNVRFAVESGTLATRRATGAKSPEKAPVRTPPVMLITTPLFHVTACNCNAYVTTQGGGKIVLMYKWDAGEALKIIERERVSTLAGVPMMTRELITHPDFATRDTSSLRSIGGGGSAMQPDLVRKIDSSVKKARPNTGFGMTETTGIVTSVSGDFLLDKPDSCGRAMPVFEAKVVGEDGEALPPGEPGELWVRGAPVIKGYINAPEATAETITDGWLHTGDVAWMDAERFIYLVDRKKDMVLRGGENIYSAEVEKALHQHAGVAECAVFGVPDARMGEEVGAAVVLLPGHALSAQDLRDVCAAQIARHKVPRYVWLLDQPLPRNASGKFLKTELRETLKVEDAA